jgi:hypothetical protein
MYTQADHQLISVPSLLPPSSYCPSAPYNTPKDKGLVSFEDAEDDTEDSEDRDMSETDYRDEDVGERKKKESISGLRKEESTARVWKDESPAGPRNEESTAGFRTEVDDAGKIRTGREKRNAPGKWERSFYKRDSFLCFTIS